MGLPSYGAGSSINAAASNAGFRTGLPTLANSPADNIHSSIISRADSHQLFSGVRDTSVEEQIAYMQQKMHALAIVVHGHDQAMQHHGHVLQSHSTDLLKHKNKLEHSDNRHDEVEKYIAMLQEDHKKLDSRVMDRMNAIQLSSSNESASSQAALLAEVYSLQQQLATQRDALDAVLQTISTPACSQGPSAGPAAAAAGPAASAASQGGVGVQSAGVIHRLKWFAERFVPTPAEHVDNPQSTSFQMHQLDSQLARELQAVELRKQQAYNAHAGF